MLLHLGTEAREEVVKVHKDVHNAVEQCRHDQMHPEYVTDDEQANDCDAHVVVDMQEGHLLLLFAKDHEDGVTQIGQLNDEVPPGVAPCLVVFWRATLQDIAAAHREEAFCHHGV